MFFAKNKKKFEITLADFEDLIVSKTFPKDENIEALSFLYLNLNKTNIHLIDGSFEDGLVIIPSIESNLKYFKSRIDEHYIMTFYYKFACLHFGAGNNKKCIEYLEKIISNKSCDDINDIIGILNLFAHYEAGLDYHFETLLKSNYKFLIKMDDLYEVQREMIKFIKGLQNIYPHDIKKAFKSLHETLKKYENHPYERRAFLYCILILMAVIFSQLAPEINKTKYKL